MANNIKIWLNDEGVGQILRYNDKLESIEREEIERMLSQIKSEFLMTFGFDGNFAIQAVQTRPGKSHGRLSYRIVANDSRTGAVLKNNQGWLAKFAN